MQLATLPDACCMRSGHYRLSRIAQHMLPYSASKHLLGFSDLPSHARGLAVTFSFRCDRRRLRCAAWSSCPTLHGRRQFVSKSPQIQVCLIGITQLPGGKCQTRKTSSSPWPCGQYSAEDHHLVISNLCSSSFCRKSLELTRRRMPPRGLGHPRCRCLLRSRRLQAPDISRP